MKKKFICTNFSQCNSADSGEIFEIEDYLATKCPTCKNTTLEEYEPPRGFCTRFKKVCMFGGGGLSLVMASYLIFGGGTPPKSITSCNNNQIKIYKDDKVIGCEDCNTNQHIDGNKCVDNEIPEKVIEPNAITNTDVTPVVKNDTTVSETKEPSPKVVTPVVPVVKNDIPIVDKPVGEKPIHKKEPVKVVEPVKPTCTKNQHIVNNKCVDNKPTCMKNQHIVNNKCVDNKPTCTKNQHISNNRCVDNIVPPQFYTLKITTTPSDAHISGVTNGARLKKGFYTITVSKEGYKSKTGTINLNANKHIKVFLKGIEETPHQSSCAEEISKIKSLILSENTMNANSLRLKAMRSGKCSESEEEIIDNLRSKER